MLVYSASAIARAGLEALLEGTPLIAMVGVASTISELQEGVARENPDVLVIDASQWEFETFQQVLGSVSSVVALTDGTDSIWLDKALRIGGRAILPRDADGDEIVGAVQAAGAGLVVLHPAHAVAITGRSERTETRRTDVDVESLTTREAEVLGLLAEGLGNKAIARRLAISEHTVKFHVGSILAKLDASSRTEAVTNGVRHGLITI